MTDRSVNIIIKGRDQVSSLFQKITKNGQTLSRSLSSLRGVVATGLGIAGLSIGVKQAVEAFGQQQEAEESVRKSLKRLGGDVEGNLNILKRYSAQLQSVSTLGDESALAIQAIAIQAGATVPQAAKLTKAAVDMAGALGVDANQAARQITKTLGGYAGELGELIPELRTLTKEQLRAGDAIDLIAKKFDGAGDAAGSYQRRFQQLLNSVGDLSEKAVETVVSALNGRENSLEGFINNIRVAVDETTNLLDLLKQAEQARQGSGQSTIGGAVSTAASIGRKLSPAAWIADLIAGPGLEAYGQALQDQTVAEMRKRFRTRNRAATSAQVDDVLISGANRVNFGRGRFDFARQFLPGTDPNSVTPEQIATAQGGALARMAQQFADASKSLVDRGRAGLQTALAGVLESGKKSAAKFAADAFKEADRKALEFRAQSGDEEARQALEVLQIRERAAELEKQLLSIANSRYATDEARAEAEKRLNALYADRMMAERRATQTDESDRRTSVVKRALAPLIEGLGLVGLGASYRQNGPAQKAQKAAEDTAKNTATTAKTLENIARRLNTGPGLAVGVIS